MLPSQILKEAVAAAFAAGMTYEQIVDAVKTQCALHELKVRS